MDTPICWCTMFFVEQTWIRILGWCPFHCPCRCAMPLVDVARRHSFTWCGPWALHSVWTVPHMDEEPLRYLVRSIVTLGDYGEIGKYLCTVWEPVQSTADVTALLKKPGLRNCGANETACGRPAGTPHTIVSTGYRRFSQRQMPQSAENWQQGSMVFRALWASWNRSSMTSMSLWHMPTGLSLFIEVDAQTVP